MQLSIMPISFVSSIHICDFAVNCLARTLEIELKELKIPVVMVRCGDIKTSGVDKLYKQLEESFTTWPQEKFLLYSDYLKKEIEDLKKFDEKMTEPVEVAKVVFKALNAKKPKSRCKVGYLAGLSAFLELLPQTFIDFVLFNIFLFKYFF